MIVKTIKNAWRQTREWSAPLRKWTRVKVVLRYVLVVAGLLLAVVPNYFNQVSIGKVYEGISFPNEGFSLNLNFSAPTTFATSIPFRVENLGYHDLTDLAFNFEIELYYLEKNAREEDGTRAKIFSKGTNPNRVKPGEVYAGSVEGDYEEFSWSAIDNYLRNADSSKEVAIYMTVRIFLYLEGLERVWITYSDVKLTANDNSEAQSSNCIKLESDINEANSPDIEAERRTSAIETISIFAISILIFTTFFVFLRRNSRNSVQIKKTYFNKRKSLVVAFLKSTVFVAIFAIWDLIALSNTQNASLEGIDTGNYNQRFQMATFVSIATLTAIYFANLLPVAYRKKFPPYSVNQGLLSFTVTLLAFVSFFAWSSTSIISYIVSSSNGAATVVRDTFPANIPFLTILCVIVALKCVNLVVLATNKAEFNAIRLKLEKDKKETAKISIKTLSSEAELKFYVFQAIKDINEEGKKATFKQIRTNFLGHEIPVKCKKVYSDDLILHIYGSFLR